jgi:hypothetical protein
MEKGLLVKTQTKKYGLPNNKTRRKKDNINKRTNSRQWIQKGYEPLRRFTKAKWLG